MVLIPCSGGNTIEIIDFTNAPTRDKGKKLYIVPKREQEMGWHVE